MKNVNAVKKISVSFSGGRSSAVMTRMVLEKFADTHEIVVTFANTGCEHEATLEFVRDCDRHWGFKTVWIEAMIGEAGVGPRAKVVDFESASRTGEPFEAAIKKHGVFNPAFPNCTGRLKVDPMWAYLRDYCGWQRNEFVTAIGIRADEIDRCNPKAQKEGLIYPLVAAGIGKPQVNAIMRHVEWDLKLPGDHYGNCVWCWKKSLRKLLTVAKHTPEAFEFPARMEVMYGDVSCGEQDKRRTFFRKEMSATQIVEMANTHQFAEYKDSPQKTFAFWDEDFCELLDVGAGCGDSCEIGTDEVSISEE